MKNFSGVAHLMNILNLDMNMKGKKQFWVFEIYSYNSFNSSLRQKEEKIRENDDKIRKMKKK